jgi:uroporphyrinogen decarboxylase
MNSLERALAAIQHEAVDRLPVDLHNFQMCADASGETYGRFLQDGRLMAEWQLHLWRKFGHDVILHENGTAALAEAVGCRIEYSPEKSPVVVGRVLNDITDVAALKPITVTASPIIRELLTGTRILLREIGGHVMVMGRSDQGPFSLAGLMLGMDKFLMELAMGDHQNEFDQLMEYCTDVVIQYAKAQLQEGCRVTSIGESLAGPDVISPGMYRKFAVQYERIVADEVHAAGGLLSLHICGNATKIIPDMIATGADILEVDEKVDLPVVARAASGNACLLGNVAPHLFRNGTPADIEAATRQTLDIMNRETGLRGFILGPGCALPGDVPHENIQAMIRVVA